jgi:hypothetical protein
MRLINPEYGEPVVSDFPIYRGDVLHLSTDQMRVVDRAMIDDYATWRISLVFAFSKAIRWVSA